MILRIVSALIVITVTSPLSAQESVKPIRPSQFGIIFNAGYAGDNLPKDKENFEKLVLGLKKASFNVVWCKYTEERAAICKKHGMKIMVDLLVADHHVYRNVEGAKKLCSGLQKNDVVYGYHLWSDNFGRVAGRNRDSKNVQEWDPTHPTYLGNRNGRQLEELVNPCLIGYYDFHWFRGGHWRHLDRARNAAKKTDSYFLRYCQSDPGRVGAGNYNRALYTISTSIPFGLKGYTYHYRGGTFNLNTGEPGALGKDVARVNAEYALIGDELLKIGNPTGVYSTPITKSAKDRPIEKPAVPAELKPIPEDAWFQIKQGEVLVGVFQDKKKNDFLFLANHNSYQPQSAVVVLKKPAKSVSLFDRKKGEWTDLKVTKSTVTFEVPAAAGELIRVTR